MKTYIYSRNWLRKTIGILLIILGIIGLILPILPGALFAVLGLEFLGIRLAFFNRLLPKRILRTESSSEVSVTL